MGCEALCSFQFAMQFIIFFCIFDEYVFSKCPNVAIFNICSKFRFLNCELFFIHIFVSGPKIDIIFYHEDYSYVLVAFDHFKQIRFSSVFIKKVNSKCYFRKKFTIFREANDYLKNDSKKHLLPPG